MTQPLSQAAIKKILCDEVVIAHAQSCIDLTRDGALSEGALNALSKLDDFFARAVPLLATESAKAPLILEGLTKINDSLNKA